MRKWLIWLGVVCAVALVGGQEQKPLAEAGVVTCEGASPGSMSAWVTSGSGFGAAVELRKRIKGTGDRRVCVTTWVLHVRSKDEKPRTIEVAQREDSAGDNEWKQENSFELEAWSSDGNMLLASQIEAGGDGGVTTPILYDFTSGTYRRIELGPIFARMTPANCAVAYRPMRFDNAGNLVISAMSTDKNREPGTAACFPEGLWLLDLRSNTISHMHAAQKPR